MRRICIITVITLIPLVTYGQHVWSGDFCIMGYILDFENTACHNQLILDTLNNKKSLWQIGKPQKEILNSAYSSPNVIITDTINPYPPNTDSHFIVKHLAWDGFINHHTAILAGYYYVDSDSLSDYGSIEFSGDNGNTWVDLINDPEISEHYVLWELSEKPILTGNSSGWNYFHVYLSGLTEYFDIEFEDTLQFKFSFLSDSIDNLKGGLMFDDLWFEDWSEGINQNSSSYLEAYPNPVSSELRIKNIDNNYSHCIYCIYNTHGNLLYQVKIRSNDVINIDASDFPSGFYSTLTRAVL